MFDLAILGLLEETDMHGYELRKRLGDLPGIGLAVSFGSLYPALGRLEKAGHVKAVSTRPRRAAPNAPMSGSLVGELAAFRDQLRDRAERRADRGTRGKKVYGITDAGRQRLHELLVDPDVADDRRFALRVAFCRNLNSAERLDLFERRRAELVRRRERRGSPARSTRVDTYLRSLVERDTTALTADLAWLDRLIAEERATAPGARGIEEGAHIETGGQP
jgi:DNA-binding PadR family transcriptional regulator